MRKLPGHSQQDTNRINGKFFEETFERFARMQGFLPKRNPLGAQPKGNNRWQPIKSQLDYNLYSRDGLCAVVDCKSFAGEFFTYSEIDKNQLKKSIELNEWGVCSGFIIWLRKKNQISFFSGSHIEMMGPRSRFTASHGVFMGKLESFRVAPIYTTRGMKVHLPLLHGAADGLVDDR